MLRTGSASVPQGATGICRDLRRAQRGGRAEWVRPFRQIHRFLDASLRIIDAAFREVETSERCAGRLPLRARRKLRHACFRLLGAESWLVRADRGVDEAKECMAGQPELLAEAAERCAYVRERLEGVAEELFLLNYEVINGLETGELVPEPPAERGHRIVLVPRPAPVGAFLRAHLKRAVDRISPVLQRRRRTRRPAALRVPRRTSQGRAPPLVPVCLL